MASTGCHKSAELARVMVPSDANVAGNVHGGTIMQLIEEAAGCAASRFMNQLGERELKQEIPFVVVLTARVESITFQQPIHVGDVAKVRAQVVFSSEHTVAVAVKVTAERMSSKEDAVCNRALLWMVGRVMEHSPGFHRNHMGFATVKSTADPGKLERAKAPELESPDKKTDPEGAMAYRLASMAYNMRKLHKKPEPAALPDLCSGEDTKAAAVADGFTPDQSAVSLAQVMLPSDCCTGTGLVSGGVVMKLMDNACGVAAVRHCGTNVVTVSVDAMDMVAPVLMGDVLRIEARPVFSSAKSLEIEVVAIVERFLPQEKEGKTVLAREEIVTTKQAYFTFVSLPLDGPQKALPMRPLLPETEEDKKRFQSGKLRYETKKAMRTNGN